MNKTQILVIGNHTTNLPNKLNQFTDNSECTISIALTAEAAIEKFHQANFDIVLLNKGFAEEEKKLLKVFTHQNPAVIIQQYVDDNLLPAAISNALARHREAGKPSFSFVDDALKNAGLNISLQ